jgi:tRNA threonylcarbamoyl adenosine modification protein YjeE
VLIRYLSGLEATNHLAEAIAGVVVADDLILLTGGIGSGKTAFTQALARWLGVTESVTSPSFVIHSLYVSGRLPISHVDLYRLASDAEVIDLGLDDHSDGGVTVVEWADRFGGFEPPYLTIAFDLGARDDERIAILNATGETWARRLRTLENAL